MSISCDVVILPNEKLAQAAIRASQGLEQYSSLFTLKEGFYFPHASLYMLELELDDLEQVKTLLDSIAASTSKLELQAIRYDHTQCFVDAEYQRTTALDTLQLTVIDALNPVRHGMREKDKVRMLEASGLALQNFKDYGYKPVGELFRPHVTFTRLTSEQPGVLSTLGEINQYGGIFIKIGLFEMGDNGNCVRKLGEWDLKDIK